MLLKSEKIAARVGQPFQAAGCGAFQPRGASRLFRVRNRCTNSIGQRKCSTWLGLGGLLLLLVVVNGCSTFSRPLPAVNLTDPGWTVHQGQAVWKLPGANRDIAGDVLVATGPSENTFVQFSKTPFPLVIGQTTSNRWQVEFPPQHKRYAGPGSPPKRVIWLYLPRVLAGKTVPRGWTWTMSDNNWRLANPTNGEALEGFFAQ